MATPIWPIEGVALDSTGEKVAGSLADELLAVRAIVDALPSGADLTTLVANVIAIKAVTDTLPDGGALTSISDETDKIDIAATDGLTGVSNSLSYRTHEAERHLHSGARWFEAATTPDAELHVADEIGSGAGAFQIDAGNDDWGAWVQILGSGDTPTILGKTHFDPHQVIIEDVEEAATYFVQITRGATGAAGLDDGTYSEFVYAAANTKSTEIVMVQTGRAPAGSKLWARCKAAGENTATMDFYIGLHEYEG